MKTFPYLLAIIAAALSACSTSYQANRTLPLDDTYYSLADARKEVIVYNEEIKLEDMSPANSNPYNEQYLNSPENSNTQSNFDYNQYNAEQGLDQNTSSYQNPNYSDSYADGDGKTYITNNYYGDSYNSDDYYYASRIRRFHNPYAGFSYYSPAYVGYYYDPFYSGFSIGFGYTWGMGYGWNSFYGGYYDPFWNPFWYPSYGSWYYSPHHAYNQGYWNGYYDGYYDRYYTGIGSSSGKNSYYRPRSGRGTDNVGGASPRGRENTGTVSGTVERRNENTGQVRPNIENQIKTATPPTKTNNDPTIIGARPENTNSGSTPASRKEDIRISDSGSPAIRSTPSSGTTINDASKKPNGYVAPSIPGSSKTEPREPVSKPSSPPVISNPAIRPSNTTIEKREPVRINPNPGQSKQQPGNTPTFSKPTPAPAPNKEISRPRNNPSPQPAPASRPSYETPGRNSNSGGAIRGGGSGSGNSGGSSPSKSSRPR